MKVKDEGTHPKPVELQGLSAPPSLNIYTHMTSSSALIQSYYFLPGPIHFILYYYPFLTIQHFNGKDADKHDLSVDFSTEARGARRARQ